MWFYVYEKLSNKLVDVWYYVEILRLVVRMCWVEVVFKVVNKVEVNKISSKFLNFMFLIFFCK